MNNRLESVPAKPHFKEDAYITFPINKTETKPQQNRDEAVTKPYQMAFGTAKTPKTRKFPKPTNRAEARDFALDNLK